MADCGAALHLDEEIRPDLLLSDERRIARIDRDRWIGYGRAREAIEELERILRSERRQRPDNLLIVGASNNGKTAIARCFLARMVPPEDAAARTSTIPVTLIQAPNGPRIPQLLTSIRSALGQPAGRRETTAQLRTETYRIMRAVGLRLLLIDDLHNIRAAASARCWSSCARSARRPGSRWAASPPRISLMRCARTSSWPTASIS